ncbi:MAG: lipid-A-disaccharide synthase [Armatimonadota bacterium]|nr:lipid-A-disaccharide synthase [Armatimonadota bacterium]
MRRRSACRSMPSPEPPTVFLLAGEVSGDIHGAALARELRRLAPDVRLEGVGGARMREAGVALLADSTEWGVMGWVDAARRVREYARRLDVVLARLRAAPPDVLVPIDFSGFNLTLLRRLRGRLRTVYYVPPMVSVRRGRRARHIAALGARLLPVFPFEAEAYRAAGADAVFVGHPAADLAHEVEPAGRIRARLGLAPGAPVLGLLPGSRRQELAALLPPMLEAAEAAKRAVPGLAVLLGLAVPAFRAQVEAALGGRIGARALDVTVLDGAREVMPASTVLLTASGTATVEAMVLGVPMVVTYRTARLNWWIVHLAVRTRWAAIPNIMAGESLVPELLQDRATGPALGAAVVALLRDDAAREQMRRRLLDLAAALGPPGAHARAARQVLAAAGRLEPGGGVE